MSRIFVSYRRADDPFGAGLVAAALRDRFGGEGVFLDTWVLNRRGDPEAGLEEGLGSSAVVLVLIGRRWEELEARRRASGERDWVAWEIREATDRGLPIIPVFLRRTGPIVEGVPAALRSALPEHGSCLVRQATLGRDVDALAARVAGLDGAPSLRAPSGAAPVGDDLGPDTVRTGVDAMLRHVVPYAQQWMRNRDLLVGTAVDVLGPDDWLRHVSAGRSPGRRSGSGVVIVTETAVAIANLDSGFAIIDSDRVLLDEGRRGLTDVTVRSRKRLGVLPVADLRLRRADGTHLDVVGLFEGAADDLLENLPERLVRRTGHPPGA
jgi:hypothetical protein